MENLAYNKNNIVGFNINNLYSYIQLFLNDKAENTKRSYSSYIDNFFSFILDKHINQVTWNDISNRTKFNILNVDRYYQFLQKEARDSRGNKLTAKTINTYMSSIKSLFKWLSGYGNELGYEVNMNIFVNVKRLAEKSQHWGEMSDEEIWNLIEYAKTESYEGEGKSVYFETLFATGLRKTATLGLTWDNITQKYDWKNNVKYWNIDVVDKGKEVSFPIADELYNKLLSIKKESRNFIFNFGEGEARKTFDRYCNEYNINKDKRNLSIHSIKHTGVLKSLAENGNDYELTKQYSHHSQTSTLFNYTNKNIDLTISPTYNFYNETDMSRIAESPQQDLVKVIMDCPEYIKKEIIRRLEMLNKNSL